MSAPATKAQVIITIVFSPFILFGMLAALCWNAALVGYWFADSFFDP